MPDNGFRIPKHHAMLCQQCTNVDCILIAQEHTHSGYLFGSNCGMKSTIYYIEANASMEKIVHTIHDDLILNPTIGTDDTTNPNLPTDHTVQNFALTCMEYFLSYAGAALGKAHTAVVTYLEIDPKGNPIQQHFQFPLNWTPPLYTPEYRKPDIEKAWAKTRKAIIDVNKEHVANHEPYRISKDEIMARKAKADLAHIPTNVTAITRTTELDGTEYTYYHGNDKPLD